MLRSNKMTRDWRGSKLIRVCIVFAAAIAGASILIGCGSQNTTSQDRAITQVLEASLAPDVAVDPLTFRRTTLIVRDIDRSLELYRDAIGMEVIYDNVITRPHKTEDRMQNIRLVFLKASDDFIGVLGLADYEYENPDHPFHTKPVIRDGFTPGNPVVLFNTNDMDSAWPRILKAPGISVLNGPAVSEYPSYDGTETIRVSVTRFYDADGILVEFNQLLEGLK